MISVLVPTYNHEKYIAKALDSILMQKTRYSMEVLVGEDASTDNTRKILEEYEKTHPDKIKVFYRETNLYNAEISNGADLRLRSRGKYLIILEGDDFWTDENKLEEEVSFLESHPEYIAVSHNCVVVDENDEPTGEKYPECKDELYTLGHFLRGIMPGQLTTMLSRNFMTQEIFDNTILSRGLNPGDKIMFFALVSCGKYRCIQKTMSAYRHIRKGGSSYSANYKYDFEKDEKWYKTMLGFARTLNNEESEKCMEALYLGCLVHGLKEKQLSKKDYKEYKKNIKHKLGARLFFIKRMWSIKITKKGSAN